MKLGCVQYAKKINSLFYFQHIILKHSHILFNPVNSLKKHRRWHQNNFCRHIRE